MKLARPDLMAYATVVVCVLGIVVLTALRVPVPDFLTFAGTTALGIGGGVALQGSSSAPQENLQGPAASSSGTTANLPAAPLSYPYEPTTGIIPRVSTHAP